MRTEDGNDDEAGEEVLCIRAFGISYMALGISIRFVLWLFSILLMIPWSCDSDSHLTSLQRVAYLMCYRIVCKI